MFDNSIILTGWEKLTINPVKQEPPTNRLNKDTNKYIFVLAGGLQENGEVNEFVKLRLNKAIDMYKQYEKIGVSCIIIVMGGGTYHKPPILNKDHYVIHESTSCANYLYEREIPQKHIYREWSSYDTIANGYYAFLNYIQPLDMKEFCVITSSFHMPRAQTIFNYFNKIVRNSNTLIHYIETENSGIKEDVLNERKIREHNSDLSFQTNIANKLFTIKDFTIWFYEDHGAYKSIIYYQTDNKVNQSY